MGDCPIATRISGSSSAAYAVVFIYMTLGLMNSIAKSSLSSTYRKHLVAVKARNTICHFKGWGWGGGGLVLTKRVKERMQSFVALVDKVGAGLMMTNKSTRGAVQLSGFGFLKVHSSLGVCKEEGSLDGCGLKMEKTL